jgi:hypothetical protein
MMKPKQTSNSDTRIECGPEENSGTLRIDKEVSQPIEGNKSGSTTNSLDRTFLKLFNETCRPNPEVEDARRQKAVLRGNGGNDAFIVTPQCTDALCISEPIKSLSGDYQGESFYGVSTEMQTHCSDRCRLIRFYGCVSQTGHHFLLVEKPSTSNSWNLSKQEAIEQGRKTPIILRSNMELKVYEFEIVNTEIEDTLDDRAFDALCEQAFKGMIIDSPDHRLLQKRDSSADIWETE